MVMKYLQRIGKSLMLPIACLPVCAILMGLGYAIDINVMSGGASANPIALFLVKSGAALIDNMGLLFAIGVAVGMSKDGNGTSALAGLVSWLVVTTLCSPGVTSSLGIFNTSSGQPNPAFFKVQNQFIGIITGLLAAHTYNIFKDTSLPAFLSFFSGKRSVSIITAGFSIVLSLILYLVWPFVYSQILVNLGELIAKAGYFGAGAYAFFNRLLIPIGLHHALNSVFWFDVAQISDIHTFWGGQLVDSISGIKGYVDLNNNIVTTSLKNVYVTLKSITDVAGGNAELLEKLKEIAVGNQVYVQMSTLAPGQAGMYQAGFFPIMMFGLPGAAFAMYHTARPEKRKETFGILGAAALASFVSGVTEPLEFSFMFLAPVLYLIHSVLTSLSVIIVGLIGARAGFWFSAGLIDYIFSCFTPNAHLIWVLPLIGIGLFAIYYFIFRLLIVKLDLKTPGREEDNFEKDANVALANDDFTKIAEIILQGLGGKDNIKSLDNCITRLRLEVKDYTLVDEKVIKSAGVAGVIRPSKDAVQVIVGMKVQFVADEMKKMVK